VPQHAPLEVFLTAKGIDQRAVLGLRHRIDGEIAPPEVFFQRDIRGGVDGEALVAAAALALGAGERVFLVGLRMQEHREILAHRLEAQPHHLFGGRAHHDVVTFLDRQAEQLVAHGSADEVDLHFVA
jgi:hypothetical protein